LSLFSLQDTSAVGAISLKKECKLIKEDEELVFQIVDEQADRTYIIQCETLADYQLWIRCLLLQIELFSL